MTDGATRTTCPYCGVGCGVRADAAGEVRGDPAHPSNFGRLCSKGAALGATLDDSQRLTVPTWHGRPVGWDTALDIAAARFAETIARHGPDSVAFYVSGQCLTEDYYVANKLMKGFIGSGNIDTNSRLCMASSVVGHVRAFGEDVVPGVYDDWEQADLVVLVGSNTAWCHPVLYQRLMAAREARGTRVVVIDPRRTATVDGADLHIQLAPETDVVLFAALLCYLHDAGALDCAWVARHATGLEAALAAARAGPWTVEDAAAACGVDPEAIETLFAWFARTERTVTVYSQGVNQSAVGTDKVNAIINCHLATARIGRPGMGPFSVTGQPNAMGGREVGGLANQLAEHMRFDRPDEMAALRAFWRAPNLTTRPGLKAVELFDAVRDGRVRALWIAATNPASSMPRAGRVREALEHCPFVVAADCWPTDTTARAHLVLPAAGWGEKDGTVTSSERRISRQRPFRAPPGEARPDWWMFAELGRRMGWGDAFAYQGPAEIFAEHAALSALANDGARVFDIGAHAAITPAAYDALEPFHWPAPAGRDAPARLFAEGGFPTPDGRARIVPTPVASQPVADPAWPLLLNTGRVRDQWHTMTRTGRAPALLTHTPEPMLALNPADAARLGLAERDLARVESADGATVLRVTLSHGQRRGEAFAPMHWTDAFASAGPVARLVTARRDPHSGQPSLKATRARVGRIDADWHGLLLRDDDAAPELGADALHWVRVPIARGHLYRLAGFGPPPARAALERLLDAPGAAEWVEMSDPARGVLRLAAIVEGRLRAVLLLAREAAGLPREAAMAALLGAEAPGAARWRVLAGGGLDTEMDEGPHVCTCFGVAARAVRHAVVTNRLATVAEIGAALKAGTNCGSCIPELRQILRDLHVPA